VEKFAVKEAPAFAVMGCDIAPLSLHDIHTYCVPAGPDCGEVVAMVCCEPARPVEDLSRGVSGAVDGEAKPGKVRADGYGDQIREREVRGAGQAAHRTRDSECTADHVGGQVRGDRRCRSSLCSRLQSTKTRESKRSAYRRRHPKVVAR